MFSKDMIFWAGFVFQIVVGVYIGYSLISGSKRASKRAETYDSDSLKKTSETLSQFMYYLGVIMFFIIILALIGVLTS